MKTVAANRGMELRWACSHSNSPLCLLVPSTMPVIEIGSEMPRSLVATSHQPWGSSISLHSWNPRNHKSLPICMHSCPVMSARGDRQLGAYNECYRQGKERQKEDHFARFAKLEAIREMPGPATDREWPTANVLVVHQLAMHHRNYSNMARSRRSRGDLQGCGSTSCT